MVGRRFTHGSRRRNSEPKGRPKGAKNFSTIALEVLNEKVLVRKDGKTKRMSKAEIGLRQLIDKFARDPNHLLISAILKLLPATEVTARTDAEVTNQPTAEETMTSREMLAWLETQIKSGGSLFADDRIELPDLDDGNGDLRPARRTLQ